MLAAECQWGTLGTLLVLLLVCESHRWLWKRFRETSAHFCANTGMARTHRSPPIFLLFWCVCDWGLQSTDEIIIAFEHIEVKIKSEHGGKRLIKQNCQSNGTNYSFSFTYVIINRAKRGILWLSSMCVICGFKMFTLKASKNK